MLCYKLCTGSIELWVTVASSLQPSTTTLLTVIQLSISSLLRQHLRHKTPSIRCARHLIHSKAFSLIHHTKSLRMSCCYRNHNILQCGHSIVIFLDLQPVLLSEPSYKRKLIQNWIHIYVLSVFTLYWCFLYKDFLKHSPDSCWLSPAGWCVQWGTAESSPDPSPDPSGGFVYRKNAPKTSASPAH